MRKFMSRNTFVAILLFACVNFVLYSCSKDDENPNTSGGIDPIVGTFKGTLDPLTATGDKYYDAIITISKVDDNHVKIEAKSGENYSAVTSKTLQVTNNSGISIQTTSDPNGMIIYMVNEKTVKIVTKDTAEGDVTFSFEGTKQ